MRNRSKIALLAIQVWKNTFSKPGAIFLLLFVNILLVLILCLGLLNVNHYQNQVHGMGNEVRENWENSPDKHPHRMAHYGYLVFREKFPLAFFDFGLDSYLGNVVFLEAHKQNTVNFSEANLSNGLLRFGEFSAGMILQVLLPLLIFFWGYDLISRDREQGTLKIIFAQGVNGFELIWGRIYGLFLVTLSAVALPFGFGAILLVFVEGEVPLGVSFLHYGGIVMGYLLYFMLICMLAVLVSAKSSSSKSALVLLIGCWLLFVLIVPKVAQVIGSSNYPNPSKIEFDAAVEAELIKQGDSHNPNDPHYKSLKDSLLKAYAVDSTQKLPFNYSGFVMQEGERLSTATYLRHQSNLVSIFKSQQAVIRIASWIDPFLAIKQWSMSLSGTDYEMYLDFQQQSEAYRFKLAQTMNQLQIENISNRVKNSSDPAARLSQSNWEEFPEFHLKFLSPQQVFKNESSSLFTLIIWTFLVGSLVTYFSKRILVF